MVYEMKPISWAKIKQIYINILLDGYCVKIKNDKLTMWHPDINHVWTIYKDTWVAIK